MQKIYKLLVGLICVGCLLCVLGWLLVEQGEEGVCAVMCLRAIRDICPRRRVVRVSGCRRTFQLLPLPSCRKIGQR